MGRWVWIPLFFNTVCSNFISVCNIFFFRVWVLTHSCVSGDRRFIHWIYDKFLLNWFWLFHILNTWKSQNSLHRNCVCKNEIKSSYIVKINFSWNALWWFTEMELTECHGSIWNFGQCLPDLRFWNIYLQRPFLSFINDIFIFVYDFC